MWILWVPYHIELEGNKATEELVRKKHGQNYTEWIYKQGNRPGCSWKDMNLNKKSPRIIVGIQTAHCSLTYHLGKLGISAKSDEPSIHILG